MANDADVQGAAVVQRQGTRGGHHARHRLRHRGVHGRQLLPHLEIAHQPFRKDETYNEQLGELARKKVGDHHWNRRVRKASACLDALFFFDHLYIGGGNASRVDRDDLGDMLERITVVDNTAGILGGIKLWKGSTSAYDTRHGSPSSAGAARIGRRPSWLTSRTPIH